MTISYNTISYNTVRRDAVYGPRAFVIINLLHPD